MVALCRVCLMGLLLSAGTFSFASAQSLAWSWELGTTGSQANLRGIAAVNDQIIWTCGSQATVLRSVDGGTSWIDCSPEGYGELEFRSLHAWDSQQACIASEGAPAVILRTDDGGQSWQETYRHASRAAFLNGLSFWDSQQGIAFGDPLDGRLLVVLTADGGRTWQALAPQQLPAAQPQEAGFAASNSALLTAARGRVWIGTGGTPAATSRLYYRAAWEATWQVIDCPLHSGASEGIFGLAYDAPSSSLLAVGGDHRQQAPSPTTAAFSRESGVTWRLATEPPPSFRSAVSLLPARWQRLSGCRWIATGMQGTDVSPDGEQWLTVIAQGVHALSSGPEQLYGVGANGRFARLQLRPER